jgi:ubiquinone/menaquinone biosynthesis C-methylase UbiE
LDSDESRARQKAAFAEVVRVLTPGGAKPSERAAAVVLDMARKGTGTSH